jgi:antitoxin component of MazEF toxin-antitoxin module
MIKKLRKISNNKDSLMITIPKFIVDLLELEANQDVDIELKGKKIIINTEIKEE